MVVRHAVRHGGGDQNVGLLIDGLGDVGGNQKIRAQGQVRAVVLNAAHRDHHCVVFRKIGLGLLPCHVL